MRAESDPSPPEGSTSIARWSASALAPVRRLRPRVAALVNVAANGANQARQRRLAAYLEHTFGPSVRTERTDGANLERSLRSIAKDAPDMVVVLGGDGTARTALETLSPLGIATAPLPGGTLNRIARALYGSSSAERIIDRLRFGEADWIPGGQVAGHKFFVASGYGAPMLLSAVREHIRRGRLPRILRALPRLSSVFRPTFSLSGSARPYNCAIVGVGPIDAAFGLSRPARASSLEVAAAHWENWLEPITLAPSVLTGTWRRDANIDVSQTVALKIDSPHDRIPALLDGEAIAVPSNALVRYNQRCGLAWRIPFGDLCSRSHT
ncbi:MAG: NAD(+)/NADH kinase [Hyphomonadaceae bacterium]|nr:NAD(+)/NADH kinase [Hyphomonadaceae bacterium]